MNAQNIHIGTLVGKGERAAEYIKAILPHGFESFQINFWQTIGAIDLPKLADEVQGVLDGSDAVVSSLAVFGNPLGDLEIDEESRRSWRACIENAERFGCELVCGFAGRVRDKPVPDSIERYREVFGELAALAEKKGVRIALENCPMEGSWQTGDWNIAFNPDAWELMFEALPTDAIGLEWEPCHQLCQLIDPLPQIAEWGHKIFHVHGKDATVRQDVIRKHGYRGKETPVWHRHPGFGDSDWTRIISELRLAGYSASIDIEGWHDPVYKDELELTGQVHALNYLKRCRGEFIEKPSGF